ncbi:HDOD domain-containing protein [Thalassotalea euphylliae]|uniref:HDOD domain-containing protein n=1 Tax=Thalassotalea euphylliae TaxID=1655234 RepID=A0A3E0TYW3_9GAMM|nr:HDOD domain-containing protein [Thalassotalea euphylliae]REL29587.1 HDOD domain-containing protein [Thalassotalea euphylliae]
MFRKLIKSAFPTLAKSQKKPNYEAFAQSKATTEVDATSPNEAQQNVSASSIPSIRFELGQAFTNYLFNSEVTGSHVDEISQFVKQQIETIITTQAKAIINELPVMPATITDLANQLSSGDFDTDYLLKIIAAEPTIAADVIKLANTTKYKRGTKDITDLKTAFVTVGTAGLLEGAIYGYINGYKPVTSAYFKQFGERIWQHSQNTADFTQEIVKRQAPEAAASAYFVGLIRNLGEMVLFQLMVEAFSWVDPDCRPNALVLKQIIDKYSIKLTYIIAKTWQLPESVLLPLAVQIKATNVTQLMSVKDKHPVAAANYDANKLSQLIMLRQSQRIDDVALEKEINKLINVPATRKIVEKYMAID